MNTDIDSFKKQARILSEALSCASAQPKTHGQCLDLIARMNGARDWNVLLANATGTYFFNQHKDNFGCDALLTRMLSTRRALGAEFYSFKAAQERFGVLKRALNRFE